MFNCIRSSIQRLFRREEVAPRFIDPSIQRTTIAANNVWENHSKEPVTQCDLNDWGVTRVSPDFEDLLNNRAEINSDGAENLVLFQQKIYVHEQTTERTVVRREMRIYSNSCERMPLTPAESMGKGIFKPIEICGK